MIKTTNPDHQIKGALILGEVGKLIDTSKNSEVIQILPGLFKGSSEDSKIAASIGLGNVSIGNPQHYLPLVFNLVDKS